MAVLTDDQKLEIVLKLARFRSHTEIVEELVAEGVATDRNQIRTYDPRNAKYEAGDKWKLIFEEARRAFVEEVTHIPVANQSYRLELLQRGIQDAIKNKKWAAAAALAEQAARDVGGVLTNQRNLTVDSRGRARDLTAEERRETLMSMIDERLGRIADQGSATVQ